MPELCGRAAGSPGRPHPPSGGRENSCTTIRYTMRVEAAGAAGGVELSVPLFAPDGGESEGVLAALTLYLRYLLQAAAVPFLS